MRIPLAEGKARLVPLQEHLVTQSRATLWLLLGAVGFVLLIASANIASLQLARAEGRRREIAVRAALGASPRRLALELLVENVLLAFAGGLLGILFAWWGVRGLEAWLATQLPRVSPVSIDGTVLGFAIALSVAAGLLFGIAPALRARRVDLLESLKEGGPQSTRSGHRLRQVLVAAEVTLAVMLAINTGLLARSVYELSSHDPGFRTDDVMTASIALPRR
jgi:predicted lysophospholipase L1 biosynthesis ABC-type transport system permease subunit